MGHRTVHRTVTVALILSVGLAVGAPSAGAGKPGAAAPGSVKRGLDRMNRALGGLIDLVANEGIDPGSAALEALLDYLTTEKYALLADIPFFRNLAFLDVYGPLEELDKALRGARGEYKDAGIDTESGVELNSLNSATAWKESLEAAFKQAGVKLPAAAEDLLSSMNSKLAALIADVRGEKIKPGSDELRKRVTELEQMKLQFLTHLPDVFGVKYRDVFPLLEEIDINLWLAGGEVNLNDPPPGLDKDELLALLRKARAAKQQLEMLLGFKPLKKAGLGRTPAVVASYDHDRPQSDVCVHIEARIVEAQRGSLRELGKAWVDLAGPSSGAVAPPAGQLVPLDASGRGDARFLVTRTGSFTADVFVIARNGVIRPATLTFDNSSPSAEPCVA